MKLIEGRYYIDGHGVIKGPISYKDTNVVLDQYGILFHPDGRQWDHIQESCGNLINEITIDEIILRYYQYQEKCQTLESLLKRIIKSTPHSMCADAMAWAEAEKLVNGSTAIQEVLKGE